MCTFLKKNTFEKRIPLHSLPWHFVASCSAYTIIKMLLLTLLCLPSELRSARCVANEEWGCRHCYVNKTADTEWSGQCMYSLSEYDIRFIPGLLLASRRFLSSFWCIGFHNDWNKAFVMCRLRSPNATIRLLLLLVLDLLLLSFILIFY